MQRGLVARRKEASGFHHHLHAELFPGKLGGVPLREHLQGVTVQHDLPALGLDLMRQGPVNGIVLEQMCQGWRVGYIVDRDDLDVLLLEGCPKEHSANSSETVYP